MNLRMFIASALIAGGLAPAGFAQTTTAPATTATETKPAETPAVPATPNETDKAFPIAEAEKPREIQKAVFDDWEVRCLVEDESRCFILQLAKDAQGNPLAEVTIIRLPDGGQAAAGATIVTSLGVLLPKGVTLVIDSGQPIGYPFLYCSRSGCFSRLGLTAATVTRMKKGASAKVVLFDVRFPDKPVNGILSLKGFTAAYDSLPVMKQP